MQQGKSISSSKLLSNTSLINKSKSSGYMPGNFSVATPLDNSIYIDSVVVNEGPGLRLVIPKPIQVMLDPPFRIKVDNSKFNVFPHTSPCTPAPQWISFQRNQGVKGFISHLIEKEQFSISDIKRGMHHYILERSVSADELGMFKPNGLHVKEMFNPAMFASGAVALPEESQSLNILQIDHHHVKACLVCGPLGAVHPSCYFSTMRKCITHGWLPSVDTKSIAPIYNVKGNYTSLDLYGGSVEKEFTKMKDQGVVQCAPSGMKGIISPMGAVLRNSDKDKCLVLTVVTVIDQESLSQANIKLEKLGMPPIKARMTNDLSASGINKASLTPAFRYPGLADGIKIIKKDHYLAKADIARYFYCFPIAMEAYWLFMIIFKGIIYFISRCMFAFAPCPYYCSTWSAEYRSWMIADNIPCCHMMDDWLTIGSDKTKQSAVKNLNLIKEKLISAGHSFGDDKEDVSQVIVYLGVKLDTVRMRMSFDAVQAKAVRIHLEMCLKTLSQNKVLDISVIRSVAGKLGWYSEVLQSSRLHLRSW